MVLSMNRIPDFYILIEVKHGTPINKSQYCCLKTALVGLCLLLLSGCKPEQADLAKNIYPDTEGWKISTSGLWIRDNVFELNNLKTGPFIRLADGTILTAESDQSFISKDEGFSWTGYPIFAVPGKYAIGERTLIRSRNGVIILAFYNTKEQAN